MTPAPKRIAALAIGVWLLIAVLAIANGTLRETVLIPALGDVAAQVASVLSLGAIIILIEWRLVRGPWAGLPRGTLLAIGAAWTAGTILFEFGLGRLVMGMSWHDLLQQYNLFAGNLWPLIPLTMLLGMPIIQAWRRDP